jgi:hypothetical protein
VALPKVNVPGSLVSLDAQSNHLLTVDYAREVHDGLTYQACYEQFGWGAYWEPTALDDPFGWNDDIGICTFLHRTLRLSRIDDATATATLLDEQQLPDSLWFGQLHVGDDRVFTTSQSYDDGYDDEGNYTPPESLIWTIGGMRAGSIQVRTKSLDEVWWAYPLDVSGQRLVAMAYPGSILSVDATDLDALEVKKHGDLPWYVESVTIDEDEAYCSLGPYGLAVLDLQ